MFPNPADNPHWVIDGSVVAEILDKFEMLPDAEPVAADGSADSEIWYRGFVLINVDKDPKFPENVRVCEGVITTSEPGCYRDEKNIEALLCRMAVG